MRHANFPIDGSLANRDVDGACRDSKATYIALNEFCRPSQLSII